MDRLPRGKNRSPACTICGAITASRTRLLSVTDTIRFWGGGSYRTERFKRKAELRIAEFLGPPSRSVEQAVKINRAAQAGQHLNTFTTQPHRPWCRRKLRRRRCLWCRRFHGDRWFWRASPAATFRANISRASRFTVVSGRRNESQIPPSSRSWLKGKEVCKKGAGTRSVFQSMTSPKPAPLAPAFGSSAGSVRLVCSQPFVRF